MNVRAILQLSNATATAALAVAAARAWTELRALRRVIVDAKLSEERLRQKIRDALERTKVTKVSSDYFDALIRELDEPPVRNERTAEAVKRLRDGKPGFPRCVRPGCGHSAWAHGDQSGHPTPSDPCHAAVTMRSTTIGSAGDEAECPCTGYRYRYEVGERQA